MERGLLEREKSLKDLIRRAKGNPDKTGNLRRDTLKQLIELTQDSQASLKILAAEGIQYFFKDFPELEEASINSVYDLCEDQSSTVRIEGYKALAQLSRAEPKWVKRNADVLLQLLQSDEPDEVTVVKQALVEHLDLDPQVTFGVLCDQLLPPEDAIDEEEQGLRERLRGLVVSFIAVNAKHCVERRATPGSAAEDVLHRGLVAAIPKLTPHDVKTVIQEIILLLPSYASSSSQTSLGRPLLQTLISRASEALRVALRSSSKPISLDDTWLFLDLAHSIAVQKETVPAIDLLVFYLSSLTSKVTLQRLSKTDQALVIIHVANSLVASGHADPKLVDEQQVAKVRRQAIDACPILFERLVENGEADARTRGACVTLLTECARRKTSDSWTVPPHFLSVFERLRTSSLCKGADNQVRHIQGLIRSIAPSILTTKSSHQDATASSKIPSILVPKAPPSQSVASTRRQDFVKNGTPASSATLITNPQSSGSKDNQLRPSKRLRLDEEPAPGVPTLLSRMGNASLDSGAPIQRNPVSAAVRQQPRPHVSNSISTAQEGLSIKGAASRGGGSVTGAKAVSPAAPSLLNRLHDNNASALNNGGGAGLGLRLGKRKEIP